MTATKVRADYENLARIAQAFSQQADCARQLLGALQKDVATLQGGDWVGKGADKFYAEMTSVVLPAMGRVAAAMSEAASTTAKISQIMKQAEDESAALFRLDSTADRVAPGPGDGLESILLSAKANANGASGDGSSDRHTKAAEEQSTVKHAQSPQMKKMLANLDPQVGELVLASKDPALKAALEKMAREGVVFANNYNRPTSQPVISGPTAKAQFDDLVDHAARWVADKSMVELNREAGVVLKKNKGTEADLYRQYEALSRLEGMPGYYERRAEVVRAERMAKADLAKQLEAATPRRDALEAEFLALRTTYNSKPKNELSFNERVAFKLAFDKFYLAEGITNHIKVTQRNISFEGWQKLQWAIRPHRQ
jgi:WXG100 family type VII secretion target